MHLVPAETKGSDHIGSGMRLREHVFDLEAGINVPVRNAVVSHGLDMFIREQLLGVAFTHDLHDLEGHLIRNALGDEVGHNAVTCSDNLRNGADAVGNQFLRVAEVNVGTVGQSGNLQQVGKGLWLRVNQHLADEVGSHLRQREGAGLAHALFLGNAQRFGGSKETHDLRVAHGNA